jgi:hypothetical protein
VVGKGALRGGEVLKTEDGGRREEAGPQLPFDFGAPLLGRRRTGLPLTGYVFPKNNYSNHINWVMIVSLALTSTNRIYVSPI